MLDSDASDDPLRLSAIPAGASVLHVVTMRLRRALDADMARTLEGLGGPSLPEWRILTVLHEKGPTTQGDLSREIVMAQAQASRALRGMQARGLVAVARDPDDRRRWIVSLTGAGQEAFARVFPAMEARRLRIDGLTGAGELEALKALATRVARALDQAAKETPDG